MQSGAMALAPVILGVAVGASALTFLAFWAYEQRYIPRRRVAALGAVVIGALAYGAYVYGALVAPRSLAITERGVTSAGWSGPPVRIAIVALPELGPLGLSSQETQQLVSRINRAAPDLVVVVGDITHPSLPRAAMEERFQATLSIGSFARLEAPLGVVAVLGPADVAYGRDSVAGDLEDAGVAVLWNRAVLVERAGAPFLLAGWAPGAQADPALAAEGDTVAVPLLMIATGEEAMVRGSGAALTILANPDCARQFGCEARRRGDGFVLETSGLRGGGLSPPEVILLTLRGADPN
jgi:predicted MPP superfamily phosphohydrolase